MVTVPRLVVAAPASGHGKTTVACGLMAALRARGLAVSGHKAGPDYIDPGYHALATGRPGRNLDPVLCGEDLVAPLFAHGAAGADIAVIEGVMGLFDGRGSGPEGSTAHVARLLSAPVVLVVDASAQGRSVAALVTGFAAFDPGIRLCGVILNRVGSDRHERILREALAGIVPVFGALRRDDGVAAPSRHLGLVPVAEREGPARRALARLAGLVTRAVDLDAVVRAARSAGPLATPAWGPDVGRPAAGRPVIAVAGGAAFSFSYAETTELLHAAGAEVASLDPLRDEALPAGTAGLVLGGGFPEAHAADLAANEPLRAAVARLAATGAPVAAECAGLLYLCADLDGSRMCGVIGASARMTPRLTLGYTSAVAAGGSLLPAGATVTGHEFHRTAVEPAHSTPPAWLLGGPAEGPGGRAEGFAAGRVHASYLHLHWAGRPEIATRLVAAAAAASPASRRPAPPATAGIR